jgi:hypothetical protein
MRRPARRLVAAALVAAWIGACLALFGYRLVTSWLGG